jgi:hypothetical protein
MGTIIEAQPRSDAVTRLSDYAVDLYVVGELE